MYKKLLLICLSAITIQTVKAQTEKGSQLLGASFSVMTSRSDSKSFDSATGAYGQNYHGKITQYTITPNYSYFIADKLDLGGAIGYLSSHQKYDGEQIYSSEYKERGFNAFVYLRKYFLYDNKVGVRTGPYLSYQNSNITRSYPDVADNISKGNYYAGGVGLDFIYFPVKRLALSAVMGNLNYSRLTYTGSTEGSNSNFNLTFANSLTLSVNYVFGK
ncbi:autotransporter outer membrane beta-barrel domain-containing protein [Mucilaginibacter phyllosphaerae]|uniref:Autotransporter outer membrane beta-barrel domain-containing protein n=1 Tax=Mucilaginibacter phyllosphaerae TaxID=1812349 RepID=A0A4Y8A7W5_9SPHI|nr:autotransporter outer membrane beta-barrel domain-containing protein [Mucilaginibacter phyllosphaerae]MBB3971153.1 hypothetical protein [Mucilaginibacter phyllosphaerae]TEW63878.1 autotransporter outer membrane beta-barrel domain-containing protein [Mucilaginibacter phyllosphaerae]GGH22780.1 hypothetical protein GCM10007352_36310 [Mucilaginibacter phyllosphaerae]